MSAWSSPGILMALVTALGSAGTRVVDTNDADPCKGAVLGTAVAGSMAGISITTSSLKLLNGQEDARLRRILQDRLISDIDSARQFVESGAVVDPASLPSVYPNWIRMIERAEEYIAAHDLEKSLPVGTVGTARRPLENLRVVKDWLSTQDRDVSTRQQGRSQ